MEAETNKIKNASEAIQILISSHNETTMSKREIILAVKKDIVAARAAGKTWKEIIDALRTVGIEVTAQHVKACIQSTKKKPKKTPDQTVEKPTYDSKSKSDKSLVKPLEKPTNIIVTGQNKIRPVTQNL